MDRPVDRQTGDSPSRVLLGQASRTPVGTEDAIRVNLPNKISSLGSPHSGTQMWWSNQDQSWADVRLRRTLDVPAGADVRLWMWNDYVIEELWDYGFVEVSTDNGGSWSQLEVRDESGSLVSTDDDPNGNLTAYGDLENGLTGSSGGWRHDWVNLTPYAESTVQVRFRYATDAAFEERGWFLDDLSITTDGTETSIEDFESGSGDWIAETGTFAGTAGQGWILTSGTFEYAQYYLAEWRTADGFDAGLRYPYDTSFIVDGEWKVTRTPYNVPGMLVWYRDSRYTFNALSGNQFEPPSVGSKGLLLLVDSHFDPLRRSGTAAQNDPSLLDNLSSRVQASNVAFGIHRTAAFEACLGTPEAPRTLACNKFNGQTAVRAFTDAETWFPGIEYRPDLDAENPLFFRDGDASAVVPSLGNEIYSTRVVNANGRPSPPLFGTPLGGGHVLGSGDPTDGRPAASDGSDPGTEADLSLGVKLKVLSARSGDQAAVVQVTPARN